MQDALTTIKFQQMRIGIILLLSFTLFIRCSPEKEENRSLLHFVPENAAAVLKINDFKSFVAELQANELIDQLHTLAPVQSISKKLRPLNYVKTSQEALISFAMDSLQGLDFTFVSSDTIPYLNLSDVTDKTIETLSFKNLDIQKYTVEGQEFYTSIMGKKTVLSSSLKQLQTIVATLDTFEPEPKLAKFYAVSDSKKLAHVWVNLDNSDQLWAYLTHTKGKLLPSSYADWLSLDISLESEGLLLNGIGTAEDSTRNYLELLSRSKPLVNATFSMLPENTSSFSSYTFQNYTSFAANQIRYLNQDTAVDSLFNTIEEIGTAHLEGEQIVLLKTFGTDQLTDYLKSIRKGTVDFQGSEIWELGETSLIADHLAPLISDFKSAYSCILENTVVFAAGTASLEKVIIAYKNGNTLTGTSFLETLEALTTAESSLISAADAEGFLDVLNRHDLKEMAGQFKASNFSEYLFGSEIISDQDFFHTSYFIKKVGTKNTKNSVTPVFKFQLETDIHSIPQFVVNHRTKKKELIVQDTDNVLYLISTNGKILWKKQLESAVQGQIHQVDLFKNGKLQLAFTTNNQFLVLDRNGEMVKPFTFDFTGGNLNPLAVFDYDGKKDYRFLVTQNDKVFMYNNKGKIVRGFKYTLAENTILEAPQHFRIGRKDYLVFKLANNTLKILNRTGNDRIKVPEKIPFSDNPIRLYQNKIAVTSDKGILYQINTNGNLEKTDLGLNPDHGMDATSKTLAIINDNILGIRGKKTTLDLGVYSKPKIFYLNDKIYVSVTDIQNQKVYLFDSQSQPIPNFPIYGISSVAMADMDNDKKPELVIKDQENSLSVFKIN